jgi:hypothetical protein
MAEFHMNVSVVGRTDGASSVAGAAYISRSAIVDERTGVRYDYSRIHPHEVLVADLGVTLPEGAPARWRDRTVLWNEVEATEAGPRAQLCRRVELALPRELSRDQQLALARRIAAYYASQGMVVDACVHDAVDGHNPHLHMLMPLRACDAGGFKPKSVKEYRVKSPGGEERWLSPMELKRAKSAGQSYEKVFRWQGSDKWLTPTEAKAAGLTKRKGRSPESRTRYLVDWNERTKAETWRRDVARMCNDALEAAGKSERVDHRSYARRKVDRIPTVHEGPSGYARERRHREWCERHRRPYRPVTWKRIRNRRIRRRNKFWIRLIREVLYQMKRQQERDRWKQEQARRRRAQQPYRTGAQGGRGYGAGRSGRGRSQGGPSLW